MAFLILGIIITGAVSSFPTVTIRCEYITISSSQFKHSHSDFDTAHCSFSHVGFIRYWSI